jgi:DNA-binding response OmpR family regulator
MPGSNRSRRVLVVDDHPDTTAILTVLFSILHYDARAAVRGRQAIRIAHDFDPGLVLLDIALPDLTGYDVLRAIRADASGNRRYVAAISGRHRRIDIERALDAGFDEYIVKPLDLAKVKGVLQHVAQVVG